MMIKKEESKKPWSPSLREKFWKKWESFPDKTQTLIGIGEIILLGAIACSPILVFSSFNFLSSIPIFLKTLVFLVFSGLFLYYFFKWTFNNVAVLSKTLKTFYGWEDGIAVLLLIYGIYCFSMQPTVSFLAEFRAEMIGAGIATLLIGNASQAAEIQEEKKRLILQMGSPDNGFAVEAARQLRQQGWLQDGSLKGVNLIGANLSGANLERANLSGANLEWSNLSGAKLTTANLSEANFGWANLSEANLEWANLSGAILITANLSGAILFNVNLSGSNLTMANLIGGNLEWANLSGAILFNSKFCKANLHGTNFSGAELRSANLSGANLPLVDLIELDLRGVNFSGAEMAGANLSGANLEWANLSGADFGGADLSAANLEWANLSGAYLEETNFSGVNLECANLSGANLTKANLGGAKFCDRASFDAAVFDEYTIWNNAFYTEGEKGTVFPDDFNPADYGMHLSNDGESYEEAFCRVFFGE